VVKGFVFSTLLFLVSCEKEEPVKDPELDFIEYASETGEIGSGGGISTTFLLFNSCQNWDSLLGSPGILGAYSLLQVTEYGDMSQISTFFLNITVC